jgi:hypothetical protein
MIGDQGRSGGGGRHPFPRHQSSHAQVARVGAAGAGGERLSSLGEGGSESGHASRAGRGGEGRAAFYNSTMCMQTAVCRGGQQGMPTRSVEAAGEAGALEGLERLQNRCWLGLKTAAKADLCASNWCPRRHGKECRDSRRGKAQAEYKDYFTPRPL